MTCQSWKSEKNSAARATRVWSGVESWIFFTSPTLIGHNFAAPWAMMMKSGSFESPKSYLLALNLKNSIVPLLTSVRTSWKVTIYYINRALLILFGKPLYVFWSCPGYPYGPEYNDGNEVMFSVLGFDGFKALSLVCHVQVILRRVYSKCKRRLH